MKAMGQSERKPLFFVGSSQRDLQAMPEDVKDVFGSALLDAQYGDTPYGARPFGEGLPSQIMKLVEDHDGDTYRAAYTVAFEGAVYVLDVFQKKAKSGVGTPKHVKDRVLARFKAAEGDHERRQSGGSR
jgi:phage-related protein